VKIDDTVHLQRTSFIPGETIMNTQIYIQCHISKQRNYD